MGASQPSSSERRLTGRASPHTVACTRGASELRSAPVNTHDGCFLVQSPCLIGMWTSWWSPVVSCCWQWVAAAAVRARSLLKSSCILLWAVSTYLHVTLVWLPTFQYSVVFNKGAGLYFKKKIKKMYHLALKQQMTNNASDCYFQSCIQDKTT